MGFGSLSVCYLCVRVWRILSMWLFTVFTITFFPTLFLLIHFCQHILLSNHDCILFLFLFYKYICMTLSVIFFVFIIIIAIQKMYNDISIHYDMLLGILNRTCWNRTRMERWNYVKKNPSKWGWGMRQLCQFHERMLECSTFAQRFLKQTILTIILLLLENSLGCWKSSI